LQGTWLLKTKSDEGLFSLDICNPDETNGEENGYYDTVISS
jgi:hypothetical protein